MINRICTWNSLRYDRELIQDMSAHLLYEECHEFDAAITDLERLDALVDITFVAIGQMWKMGLNADQIKAAINIVCDANNTKSAEKIDSNKKYGSLGKGIYYISPNKGLTEILNRRTNGS